MNIRLKIKKRKKKKKNELCAPYNSETIVFES